PTPDTSTLPLQMCEPYVTSLLSELTESVGHRHRTSDSATPDRHRIAWPLPTPSHPCTHRDPTPWSPGLRRTSPSTRYSGCTCAAGPRRTGRTPPHRLPT